MDPALPEIPDIRAVTTEMSVNQQSPKAAERVRAFEIYCTVTPDGRRRSLRSIAQQLGVQQSTVQYWHKTDKWDERLKRKLTEAANATLTAENSIRALLRLSVEQAVREVQSIVNDTTADKKLKIMAMKQLAELAVRLKAIDPDGSTGPMESEFDDSLPEGAAEGDPEPSPESVPAPVADPSGSEAPEDDSGGLGRGRSGGWDRSGGQ